MSGIISDTQSGRDRTGFYGFYNMMFHSYVSSARNGIEFEDTWNSYKEYKGYYRIQGEIEFADIIQENGNGDSALRLAADAAVNGKPNMLFEMLELYGDKINLKDVTSVKPVYTYRGYSERKVTNLTIITQCIAIAKQGQEKPLLWLLERFKGDLQFNQFCQTDEQQWHKWEKVARKRDSWFWDTEYTNTTDPFLSLAKGVAKGARKAFEVFWKTYHQHIGYDRDTEKTRDEFWSEYYVSGHGFIEGWNTSKIDAAVNQAAAQMVADRIKKIVEELAKAKDSGAISVRAFHKLKAMVTAGNKGV